MPCGPSPNPSPSALFPFYRTLPGPPSCPPIHLSWYDRSPHLRLSPDALTATTDRGYRSVRANIGVREGTWYYEAIVERGDGARGGGAGTGGDTGNAHVRIGWGRREANFDGPVGMDAYGYGIRDVGGEKVHISRPKPYGKSFGTGDVIGCLITLPPYKPKEIRRKRIPIRYKGQLYFEMDEYGVQKEMEALVDREGKAAKTVLPTKGRDAPRPLPTLPGSRLEFFLNGEPLGTAFENIYDFTPLPPPPHATKKEVKDILYDDGSLGYFPMISMFGRGKVRCNFGPDWRYPPAAKARPMVDRFDEFKAEEAALDERDEERDAEKLRKEMREMEESERKAGGKPTTKVARLKQEVKEEIRSQSVVSQGSPQVEAGPEAPGDVDAPSEPAEPEVKWESLEGGQVEGAVSATEQTPQPAESVVGAQNPVEQVFN